ncbi:sorbosone dehydrogenase family protein [Bacillus sp. 31A1R]|uniref:Sorbosone dehydrogenase family protein n=1 Tax=Robertmurraya mangrovi TaxID=3098077 RepID=A0ABU5IX45_9BACI|nr:sorbosone dehydrogenase family protein [Bacillus sp. 31A1R]MDZ5471728.1 sorbosone dehydrogenase family protein [Bacillus sp. 31A1R]
MRKLFTLLLFVLFLMGCSHNQKPGSVNQEDKEVSSPRQNVEVVAENLKIPWAINKIDDNFYVSERTGSIVEVKDNQLKRQKVVLEKPLSTAAEAGLLGFVLSPDFSSTQQAYAYYTYENNGKQYNRIVILTFDGTAWKEGKLLIDRIPSGQYHHGGRLAIGPDQKLYATTGDATEPDLAQDKQSLGGKILRMNLDGFIPSDNPFGDSYVYSVGHRNPQGLAWTSEGILYASEHGPSAHDEINQIQAGKNYGWPVIQGDEAKQGMETPLFQSGNDFTWAPSGLKAYNNKLYVATLRGNAVREFDLKTGKSREVISGLGRIRDIYIEGNTIYFVSNNTDGRGTPQPNDDKLYKIQLEDL